MISGEEEAAYAWVGVNYMSGSLLNASWGFGTAGFEDELPDGRWRHGGTDAPPNARFGTLELGGCSAQIAFYRPQQDVLANLFKVQLGADKHWNIYAHSFLHYGARRASRAHGASFTPDAGQTLSLPANHPGTRDVQSGESINAL